MIKKAELKAKNAKLEAENIEYIKLKVKIAKLEVKNIEYNRLKIKIAKLEAENAKFEIKYIKLKAKNAELEAENAELLKSLIEEYMKKLESKKNRKFQTSIQIAKEILNEEPITKYHPSFLNRLELDAFFQKYWIALEMQEAQHWLYSTSWYKDVKDNDRQKRFSLLRYGTTKNQKSLFLKGYKKLRSLHPKVSISYNLSYNSCNSILNCR